MIGPFIVAAGVALAPVAVAAASRSSSPRLRRLAEPIASIPHGPPASWTRAMHRRAAILGALGLAGCWVLTGCALAIGDHWKNGTRENMAFAFVGMMFFMGGIGLGWWGVAHLVDALRREVPAE